MHRVNRINYATSHDAAAGSNGLAEPRSRATRPTAPIITVDSDAAVTVLLLRRLPRAWRDAVIALVTTPSRNGCSDEGR